MPKKIMLIGLSAVLLSLIILVFFSVSINTNKQEVTVISDLKKKGREGATGELVEGANLISDKLSLERKKKEVSVNVTNKLEPEIQNELNNLINTSSEGLKEVKTEDGVMVDLGNHFRTAPVAKFDESGEVVVQDYVSPPFE